MRFFVIGMLIAFVVFGIYLDVEAQDAGYSDSSEGSDNSDLLLAGALGLAGVSAAAALYMHNKGKKNAKNIQEHQNYVHGGFEHDGYAHNGYGHAEYGPHPEHDVYEHRGYGPHSEPDVYGHAEYGPHIEHGVYEHRGYGSRSEHGGYVPYSEHAVNVAHPTHI